MDLSGYFEKVEATDVSASQIANAPATDRVRFSVQPAEATTFPDNSFDVVCVAQALHWFDCSRFWPEVKRVLRPGELFAAWNYNWPRIDLAVDAVLKRGFLDVIKPFWAPRNKILWDGYKDVAFPFPRLQVRLVELTMHWSVEQFFAYLHSWSATRRCMEAQGDGFFAASLNRVGKVWGSDVERPVSMDLVLIAGRNVARQIPLLVPGIRVD